MQRTLFTRGFNIATSRNTQIPTHIHKLLPKRNTSQ